MAVRNGELALVGAQVLQEGVGVLGDLVVDPDCNGSLLSTLVSRLSDKENDRFSDIAWRWLKVPRCTSCPDIRTWLPSSMSEPKAIASAVAKSIPGQHV